MLLSCSMVNNNKQSATTQGVDPEKLTPATIKTYLQKDIGLAVGCLNAILSDPDMLESLAQFMYGRYLNASHKPKTEE